MGEWEDEEGTAPTGWTGRGRTRSGSGQRANGRLRKPVEQEWVFVAVGGRDERPHLSKGQHVAGGAHGKDENSAKAAIYRVHPQTKCSMHTGSKLQLSKAPLASTGLDLNSECSSRVQALSTPPSCPARLGSSSHVFSCLLRSSRVGTGSGLSL